MNWINNKVFAMSILNGGEKYHKAQQILANVKKDIFLLAKPFSKA